MLRFAWKLHPWLNRPSWIHFRDQNWNLTALYSSKSRFKILGPTGSPACAVDFLTSLSCQNHLLSSFSRHLHFFFKSQLWSNLVNRALKSLEIAPEWLEIFCYLTHTILILHLITYLWYISSHFISWRVIFQFRSRGGRMITSLNFPNLDSSDFLITWGIFAHISTFFQSIQVLGQSNPNPWGPSFVLEMVLEINLLGI